MTKLAKYMPQHEIHTMDGEVYYIASEHVEAFDKQCEECRFVKIGESRIAVHQIKKMIPTKLKTSLKDLQPDHRKRVEARIKEFKTNLNREPSEAETQNIIDKYK